MRPPQLMAFRAVSTGFGLSLSLLPSSFCYPRNHVRVCHHSSPILHLFQMHMEGSSYTSDRHSSAVSSSYKTERIDGCEVFHRNLTYGKTTIHFVECGNSDGEAVILVHGFPNFWFVWKNQLRTLAEAGYRVIAPDLRGYNTSSRPTTVESYGQDHVTYDLLQLVNCCSKDQAVLMVGHDWGGVAVWAFAEMFPNRVKKIIIVNSPHFHSFRNLYQSSVQQRLRSWYFVFFQLTWIPEAFLRFNRFWALRRMLYAFKSHSEDDVNRYVEAFASPGALTGMINYYRALHAGYWSKVGCSHIQTPVEVIWGAKDPYLDSRLAYPPEHLVPNATVLLFPQLAHWPMWDDSQIFNRALLKSLA